jgi:hypothetical protein
MLVSMNIDRAIAQIDSHWFPTMAAWVQDWSGHVGFVVDKAALRQVSFEYFCFSC